jgi:hypothetical protein
VEAEEAEGQAAEVAVGQAPVVEAQEQVSKVQEEGGDAEVHNSCLRCNFIMLF